MIESGNKDIYIVCGATDMRKGVDGLAAIVNLSLACDFSGESMFIFCDKSASEAICTQTAMRIWQTRCRIRRCGCRAHVRRKIHEGIQAVLQEQPACASQKGLEYCDRLFALERDYTKLTLEERRVKRLEQSKAITDALFAWASNTP